MSTKFFNNADSGTLFAKLQGIAKNMASFDRFWAVAGYFRSSGYFKLRSELGDVKEIKVLVGINIDDIFRKRNRAMLGFESAEKAKEIYTEDFRRDIKEARYTPEIEQGILQLCDDLAAGRLEMRIYSQKNLHAKFYLCLPQEHNENTDGWVIMGSSNISDSGLGLTEAPRYELNVAMKDYEDVKFCREEFEKLWDASKPLTLADIDNARAATYLGQQPTPYELYMKVLIDTFGDQVEDDFSMQLPEGVKDLKYQKDAVVQGYQMLMRHGGLFLADVVGLGKTMIAAMIAKRFIEANGRDTNILVVYPPALEANWRDTFRLFGIAKRAQFVANGSLSKVLEGKDQYKDKEEFQLVVVDEAHGFRNDGSGRYDDLQKICKSPCARPGLTGSLRKRVMLLSATPLNNDPEDLLNQLLLFQDSQLCTIDGVPSLRAFFSDEIVAYRKLMRERSSRDVTSDVDKIYARIRERVIDKVTVRRTRSNIMNDPDYRADIEAQGIVFPRIEPPHDLRYRMSQDTARRFYYTLPILSDEQNEPHLFYARYRAVEFLLPEFKARYLHADQIGQTLSGLYRVHMVKRLESSFHAFKLSLATLLRITRDMLAMFDQDKVLIIPDLNVKDLQAKGWELDKIIEHALAKGHSQSEIEYRANQFRPEFRDMLVHDEAILANLCADWEQETGDPKFELFASELNTTLLNPAINPTGKIVLFTESIDTLDYLSQRLTQDLGRTDVLAVTSKNRNERQRTVRRNFDANSPEQEDNYNIVLSTDVLAEGINLHRANVIVNYDSPWNATRLMQRIGRVNRIGSTAPAIHNYMFYPSAEGDKEIALYKNALIKLQGFHSAFGEDAQIYSREEIVKQFELFDSHIKDAVDKKIVLLRELRELYNTDRKLYHRIKAMPMKCRTGRQTGHHEGTTVVFISSNVKTEFYIDDGRQCRAVDFLDAVRLLRAKPEEKPVPIADGSGHYEQVNRALAKFDTEYIQAADTQSINRKDLDKISLEAKKFLRYISQLCHDARLLDDCRKLDTYIDEGVYSQLPVKLRKIARTFKGERDDIARAEYDLQVKIAALAAEYQAQNRQQRHDAREVSQPQIVVSETFV